MARDSEFNELMQRVKDGDYEVTQLARLSAAITTSMTAQKEAETAVPSASTSSSQVQAGAPPHAPEDGTATDPATPGARQRWGPGSDSHAPEASPSTPFRKKLEWEFSGMKPSPKQLRDLKRKGELEESVAESSGTSSSRASKRSKANADKEATNEESSDLTDDGSFVDDSPVKRKRAAVPKRKSKKIDDDKDEVKGQSKKSSKDKGKAKAEDKDTTKSTRKRRSQN